MRISNFTVIVARSFDKLLKPKLIDEEARRKEHILNMLLVATIILSASAVVIIARDVAKAGLIYSGFPLQLIIAINLTFLAFYFFSRAGKSRLVAHFFVLLYLIPAVYTSYRWGIDTPQAILVYALVIVMSGILVSTKFALAITVSISGVLVALTYLQINDYFQHLTYWNPQPLNMADAAIYSLTLGIITIVSWLSNREIEKALRRARGSEKALKKERDRLEIKVDERTEELKRTQLEKILHLYRLADFGRITAGLFHDLSNSLTTVSLNLEKLNRRDTSLIVKRAVQGTRRMEEYVKSVRKQIRKQEVKEVFSLNQEINQAIRVLDHKAQKLRVKLNFVAKRNLRTYGNPLRFNQLVTNLAANAIDAYEKLRRRKNREVVINLQKKNNNILLVVQDFGCGILKKNLKKIFDPFFTTKDKQKGTGIGLSICKDIVEKELGGKIEVESKEKEETTFTIRFSLKKVPVNKTT